MPCPCRKLKLEDIGDVVRPGWARTGRDQACGFHEGLAHPCAAIGACWKASIACRTPAGELPIRKRPAKPGDHLILLQCRMVLAPRAPAARPDQPADMGTDETPDRPMAPTRAHSASAPRRAVQRHDPRWKPGAVVPLAGLRGAARNRGPYRDTWAIIPKPKFAMFRSALFANFGPKHSINTPIPYRRQRRFHPRC
jgi:hypothetical protein